MRHLNKILGSLITLEKSVAGDGGWDDVGLIIKNNNSTSGECAVSFQNISTGSNYWMFGLNQSDDLKLAYGTSFIDGATRLTITDTGEFGIGTLAPTEKVDVVGTIKSTTGFKTGSFQMTYNDTTKSLDFNVVG